MSKFQIFLLTLISITLSATVYYAADYLAIFKVNKEKVTTFAENIGLTERKPVAYKVEEVARGLDVPWSIVFTSDSRALISERSGRIKVLDNGVLVNQPLIYVSVSSRSEDGMMGLAVDPDYLVNKFFYACYSYDESNNNKLVDTVIQLKDNGESATVTKILLDKIPAAAYHAGCRLGFGPDKKLYITTGDATDKQIAQDVNSLGGKILRINTDGSIPEDNPITGSPVYSYGHRNPQGITWDKETGIMLQTEHGPSIVDGPAGGDEVNVIIKGQNYGWPLVSHSKSIPNAKDPVQVYTPAVAPASALMYSGKMFPQFKQDLFFGGLKGEGIYRVSFTDQTFEIVAAWEKLPGVELGRIREITEAPNGEIYFSTSNRDGRGKVLDGDDKIYKLTPVAD